MQDNDIVQDNDIKHVRAHTRTYSHKYIFVHADGRRDMRWTMILHIYIHTHTNIHYYICVYMYMYTYE